MIRASSFGRRLMVLIVLILAASLLPGRSDAVDPLILLEHWTNYR